ncbi:unnamed protein product [Rhizophagus irregularis]|nr:unnamed protein product [Rhizophagus irregularis]
MRESSEQLRIPQRESGKEQYLNSNELEYQEKLAEACGVSLEKHDLRQLYNQPMKLFTIQFKRRILTSPERVLDAPGLLDNYYLNLLDWTIKNMVAIGLDQCVYIWNADIGGIYTARIGVIIWNKHIISSGCKDGNIWHHDTRVAQHKVAELIDHTSEVCGLKWNSNGDQLASGGNDNRVNIWDALAWCPWQSHILALGGSAYSFLEHFKELLSTHGFPNHNMTIWSYPTLNKTADIPAHESGILHSTISPDNQVVATAASDENLKFWRVFQNLKQ